MKDYQVSAIAYKICAGCIKAVLPFISSVRGSPLNGVNSTRSQIPAELSFISSEVFGFQEKGKKSRSEICLTLGLARFCQVESNYCFN